MLSWLKDILGDNYTEDIEKKDFTGDRQKLCGKGRFQCKNDALKNLEAQVRERDTQLETLKKVNRRCRSLAGANRYPANPKRRGKKGL